MSTIVVIEVQSLVFIYLLISIYLFVFSFSFCARLVYGSWLCSILTEGQSTNLELVQFYMRV